MKKLLISILLILSVLTLTACGDKTNSDGTVTFVGFEVSQSATVESGTYYEFETPEVTADGETVPVIITVMQGENVIPHDGFKVYVDSVGKLLVTYKVKLGDTVEEKTTTLTAVDTTAPVIANTLKQAVKYNTQINLSDYVRVKDVSNIKTVTYTVTKLDGTALPSGTFNPDTKILCVSDQTVRAVKLTITATDDYDNAQTESFEIPLSPEPTYGSFDFEWFEVGQTDIGGITVSVNTINTYTAKIEDDNGEKVLTVKVNTTAINQYVTITLPKNLIGEYQGFDYFDVEMLLDCTYNGGNGGLSGAEFAAAPVNVSQNVFTAHKGQWFTYRYSGESARQSVQKNEGIGLMFKPWGAQEITIKIKSVTGVYNDKTFVSDGSRTFNFNEVLGINASDVKNVTFDNIDVTDLTAFKPKKKGVLKFTYCKDGYKETQITINLNVVPIMVENGSANDNDISWGW